MIGVVVLLVAIAAVLLAARIGGWVATRLGQPGVLGELTAGMALGVLVRAAGAEALLFETGVPGATLDALATIGIVLLLFDAGLETRFSDMRRVGGTATAVAVIGVAVPVIGGVALARAWIPRVPAALLAHMPALEPGTIHLFIGSTLAATSVGITARVFRDLHATARSEARIVLGAAVIDDILGLVLLAVVAGAATMRGAGEALSAAATRAALEAVLVLGGGLLLGRTLVPVLLRRAARIDVHNLAMPAALAVCCLFAAATAGAGLSPIVGAFAAGLILEDAHFHGFRGETDVRRAIAPLLAVFAPIFFVRMGALVDVRRFLDPDVLRLGAALSVIAVGGKLVSAMGVRRPGVRRWIVGVGMIPRGEVGLTFAAVGRSLGVLDDGLFAALVFVVTVTTVMTPPWLRRTLEADSDRHGATVS